MRVSIVRSLRSVRPSAVVLPACAGLLAIVVGTALRAAEPAGRQLYAARCAACHGAQGEGVPDEHAAPLVGDKSLSELTRLVQETMPADSPGTLSAAEADRVTRYVYDAFYSEIAQARNRPARIQLSRLTVRQYENAVADLLASFGRTGRLDDRRGLQARLSKSRGSRSGGDRGGSRGEPKIDKVVDVDFGTESPVPDDDDKEDFSARWEGSVIAGDTGDYEFIVRTANGVRLYVNNELTPLIDAGVRSGELPEYRETIRLLGGRVYPLRLEFSKTKADKGAKVRLLWRPPHHAEELVPERCLAPERFPVTFVLATPFPPDDRSTGFERGTSISKEWHEAATLAALEVAAHVAENLSDYSGARRDSGDRERRVREFCRTFAERALRRPLSEEERRMYVDQQFDGMDVEESVKRVVLLVLTSPRFLYREAGRGAMDGYDVASWLSFTLWDSLPDEDLLKAAREDKLQTREQIAAQADRMASDLRTRSKVREFLHQWLKVDHVEEIAKNSAAFPEFDERIESDLRTSLDLFLDDVVWGDHPDFRRLLLADKVYMNGRLAEFYGVDLPADAAFEPVVMEGDGGERAGVLTHPFLLSAFAYDATSSPIHRGVFIARSILGRVLMPPPIAVAPLSPDLHEDMTTRERVVMQTSPGACVKCHAMINPLGFSLEQFDAVGRFRSEERGKPIDATGSYVTRSGETVKFNGVRELAEFLCASEECPEAFAEQLFQYLVKQPVQAFGPEEMGKLRQSFVDSDYNIRRLLVEVAATSVLRARELQSSDVVARAQSNH